MYTHGFFNYQETPHEGGVSNLVEPLECGEEWIRYLAYTHLVCKDIPMRIRQLNHSTYEHQYHIVWGTKGRRKILKSYVLLELKRAFYKVCKTYPTLWIESCNTDEDHVHLQIEIPPNIAVSDAVSKLKSTSSLYLRKKFKFIREIYLEKDGIWSVGYFSSTVGLNEEKIRKYIAWQGKKDKPQKSRLF